MLETPRADALLTALISGELQIEAFAALTEEHEREKALQVLIAMLDDSSDVLRLRAVKALGVLGDRRAVEALLVALDPDEDENAFNFEQEALHAKVETLVAIRDPEAILPLLTNADISSNDELLSKLLGFDKEDLVCVLEDVVTDPILRESALFLLGSIDHPKSIKLLIEALSDQRARVRSAAAIHLGRLNAVDAVPFLLLCTTDQDREVRRHTAVALGDLSDPQAIPALLSMLNDEKHEIRMHAAIALGKLGNASGMELIYEYIAFRYTRSQSSYFDDALEALRRLREPLVPLLMALDQRVYLYRTLEYTSQLLIVDLLAEFPDPATLPLLERLLESDTDLVRQAAQQAIDHITGNRAESNDE